MAGRADMKSARTLHTGVAAAAAAALLALGSAGGAVADSSAPVLTAGSAWVVEKTTTLAGLSIPPGVHLRAPPGHGLTMTVAGVDTAMAPGAYQGKVVLTPTEDIVVKSASVAPHALRTALYIEDGRIVPEKSVTAAVVGGVVTGTHASDISITSRAENFNGIIVTGTSRYVFNRLRLDLTGNGGDDTDGFGAGILTSGHAEVTLDAAKITTRGAIRTAVFVAGYSTMHINNSAIEVFPGTLPAGYQENIGDGRVMMEVPWMLGLSGNVRATNTVEHGTIYYQHSHIKSHGWGALSTDGVQVVRLYADDTLIENEGAGYGAYALGDAIDTFRHCRFEVVDYGLIVGGKGTGVFTDGTRVHSQRFGVMLHQGGGGSLIIDKGSQFHTGSTLIEIKGRGANIAIDGAQLRADNGVLVQTMDNDDPFMKAMMAKGGMPPGAGLSPGPAAAPPKNDVAVSLSHVRLQGDLLHAQTDLGEMIVALKSDVTLSGAISTAVATPATGKDPTRATYREIGEVRNALGPATGQHGLSVSIESGSEWTVGRTSYLTKLDVAEGASVRAPAGHALVMKVNGADTELKPGHYVGQIELGVRASAG